MTEKTPNQRLSPMAQWLLVFSGTCIACYLGYWYLQAGGRTISLMWPAAGVSVAFFVKYGLRVAPAVMAGHLAVWTFVVPGANTWPILLVPVLYPMEAWLVSQLGYRHSGSGTGSGSALWPVVWSHLAAPILCSIPCAILMAFTFTLTGRFPTGAVGTTVFLIVMAHLHGMIAFGSLTLHLLEGDFNHAESKQNWRGALAGMGALAVMTLAFTGAFDGFLSKNSAIFLPFPLLAMAAVWLPPAPVSLFVAAWCVLSTALTCMGFGPFTLDGGNPQEVMSPAELGLYNTVMASVAYLISVGSHHLLRQIELNEISLAAADIELWEWDENRGFSWVREQRASTGMREAVAGHAGLDDLGKLAGLGQAGVVASDSWRVRIKVGESPAGGNRRPVLLESVGRILQRGLDDRPTKAIGLLQDLSSLRKAEEALVALGHQKAKLRDLQAKFNPHFLFNSLNVVRALIHIDPKSADHAITSLAELLRGNLRAAETPLISLGEELSQIRALLHLASLRFGSRLETRVRVPNELGETRVPPMLLLNLVENAITHGIGNLEDGGIISLTARHHGNHVRITVTNSGVLSEKAVRGIGARDASQRLEQLFAGNAKFSLSQSADRTVTAEVILPFLHFTHEPQDQSAHLSHR